MSIMLIDYASVVFVGFALMSGGWYLIGERIESKISNAHK
jgi:hypothetical protein